MHGVDREPQPNYCGEEFTQADVLEFIARRGHEFDAIHTSVPCQGYSGMTNCRPGLADEYDRMLAETRELLINVGRPWVMENVMGSGLPHQGDLFGAHGVMLCGSMFGRALYRHRLFETSFPAVAPNHPRHLIPASKAGHWKPGTVISVAGNCHPIALAREVMDIDWTTRDELAEAIPPYFTEYLGIQMLDHLGAAA